MKIKILVIGRHAPIMETILRLINTQTEYEAFGAITDDEALTLFNQHEFQLVLIGGGVEETSEQKLKTIFERVNPKIKMIRHFGGGSGLLFNELKEALSK